MTAIFSRIETSNNDTGMLATGVAGTGVMNVTVADSVMANNTLNGIFGFSNPGGTAVNIMLVRCVVFSNGAIGARTFGSTVTLRSFQTAVTANATGWSEESSSNFLTYGNNGVDGNTTEVSGTPTILPTR